MSLLHKFVYPLEQKVNSSSLNYRILANLNQVLSPLSSLNVLPDLNIQDGYCLNQSEVLNHRMAEMLQHKIVCNEHRLKDVSVTVQLDPEGKHYFAVNAQQISERDPTVAVWQMVEFYLVPSQAKEAGHGSIAVPS